MFLIELQVKSIILRPCLRSIKMLDLAHMSSAMHAIHPDERDGSITCDVSHEPASMSHERELQRDNQALQVGDSNIRIQHLPRIL